MIKYSFIVPVKKINEYIRESIPKILKINRDDYEIIIFPDESSSETWTKTKQVATGPGGPAMKRSLAIKEAQGEVLIFIDDDAYPNIDFLKKLDAEFADQEIVAVGGPAITPKHNSFQQKVSGAVFLSPLSGGCPERYVPIGEKRFVDDWPSVNLSVRKNVFEMVGGFDSNYWPGEDTLFCLELIKKTGKKILYLPEALVYHHRREGFWRHMKQVGAYGLHRGHFARKFPKTSRRFKYFLPSLFLVYIVVGLIVSLQIEWLLWPYIAGLFIYVLALIKAFFDIRKHEKRSVAFVALPYIFGTHIAYGSNFIKGLFKKQIKISLR
ncbi:glycosyltransferase [Candidatus Falkowbacteria bacterium]|jgi:cellulose synthase/poly-beta-1,6-N-acetylglucosamine synthase-like glycosyltransferase|nr:glycosyltransferase [Candidatus Falkowbacteria bacterium]MBT5502739.1 glycosyltransferase [Candidatus Falkowbacteria bacterium]MBT6573477.1 glycosyltransferase [Candidatus Falkowbacteria bacterium]MBT7501138.1 glycosyltransferase [Candidatus Falkowbacteria bacterium]